MHLKLHCSSTFSSASCQRHESLFTQSCSHFLMFVLCSKSGSHDLVHDPWKWPKSDFFFVMRPQSEQSDQNPCDFSITVDPHSSQFCDRLKKPVESRANCGLYAAKRVRRCVVTRPFCNTPQCLRAFSGRWVGWTECLAATVLWRPEILDEMFPHTPNPHTYTSIHMYQP